jgi:NADH:ubiquinone oxidoreductase subunit F (NADH-binding)
LAEHTDVVTAPAYEVTDVLPWASSGGGSGLLLPAGADVEGLDSFRQRFPEVSPPDAERLVESVRAAGLRGRGGAGFPSWRKLHAVAAARAAGPVAVVANGEEGEPASCKDRYLLRHRPHVVLEGLDLVRRALDADLAYVYVSDVPSRDRIREALAERRSTDIQVFLAPPGYVSGEETSVVRALNGGPALPTQKPPRPFEVGVAGLPTVVMNVESLARVAQIWAAEAGGMPSGGVDHLLLTVLDESRAALVEVPMGSTLRDIARRVFDLDLPVGCPVLAGGFFSGFLPPEALDVGLGYDEFRQLGTGVGCGSFAFLPDSCPVQIATDVMAFFDRENAHQCGSCFKGTAAMHAALSRIGAGHQTEVDAANLERWAQTLPGRGSCATLDGAACLARTLMTQYADVVALHAVSPCDRCAAAARMAARDTRFRVSVP